MNSKKTTLFFVTISIILVLTVIHATNIFYSSLNDQKKELKLIEIKKGMGLSEISLLLLQKEIINHRYIFNIQIIIRGSSSKLRVGNYELSPSMTQNKIYKTLIHGNVATRSVTIPEGFTVKMIVNSWKS